jgi:hypothetical protein
MTLLFFPHHPRAFAAWIPDAWTRWSIGATAYRRRDDGRVQSRDEASGPWFDVKVRPVTGAKAQVAA